MKNPTDKAVNKFLSSHGVNWKSGEHFGLSFLSEGRASNAWELFSSEIVVKWDRIGRVRKTESGTEWLLEKHYCSIEDYLEPKKALEFRADEYPKIVDSSDIHSSISVIEFLRIHGVCCRMLIVHSEAIVDNLKKELNKLEVFENSKLKNRIFLLGSK